MRGLTEMEIEMLRCGLSADGEWDSDNIATDEEIACCKRLVKRGLLRMHDVSDGEYTWFTYTTTELGRLALRCQDPSP